MTPAKYRAMQDARRVRFLRRQRRELPPHAECSDCGLYTQDLDLDELCVFCRPGVRNDGGLTPDPDPGY